MAVSLEPTIEVVQVANPRNAPCRGIEQLAGEVFAQHRVVPFFLPSADQVIPLLGDEAAHLGQLLGLVLQIGIKGTHNPSARSGKTALQAGRLPIVTSKAKRTHLGVFGRKTLNLAP